MAHWSGIGFRAPGQGCKAALGEPLTSWPPLGDPSLPDAPEREARGRPWATLERVEVDLASRVQLEEQRQLEAVRMANEVEVRVESRALRGASK